MRLIFLLLSVTMLILGCSENLDEIGDAGTSDERSGSPKLEVDVRRVAFTGSGIVAPYDCRVLVSVAEANTAAESSLGHGASREEYTPVITGIPSIAGLSKPSELGTYRKGEPIALAILTQWAGKEHFASTALQDVVSQVAFADTDDSLEERGMEVVEPLGPHTFLLHLDDAGSHTFDDSDDDILLEIDFVPIAQ